MASTPLLHASCRQEIQTLDNINANFTLLILIKSEDSYSHSARPTMLPPASSFPRIFEGSKTWICIPQSLIRICDSVQGSARLASDLLKPRGNIDATNWCEIEATYAFPSLYLLGRPLFSHKLFQGQSKEYTTIGMMLKEAPGAARCYPKTDRDRFSVSEVKPCQDTARAQAYYIPADVTGRTPRLRYHQQLFLISRWWAVVCYYLSYCC